MEIQDILRNLQIEQLTPMQEATREAYRENKDLVRKELPQRRYGQEP